MQRTWQMLSGMLTGHGAGSSGGSGTADGGAGGRDRQARRTTTAGNVSRQGKPSRFRQCASESGAAALQQGDDMDRGEETSSVGPYLYVPPHALSPLATPSAAVPQPTTALTSTQPPPILLMPPTTGPQAQHPCESNLQCPSDVAAVQPLLMPNFGRASLYGSSLASSPIAAAVLRSGSHHGPGLASSLRPAAGAAGDGSSSSSALGVMPSRGGGGGGGGGCVVRTAMVGAVAASGPCTNSSPFDATSLLSSTHSMTSPDVSVHGANAMGGAGAAATALGSLTGATAGGLAAVAAQAHGHANGEAGGGDDWWPPPVVGSIAASLSRSVVSHPSHGSHHQPGADPNTRTLSKRHVTRPAEPADGAQSNGNGSHASALHQLLDLTEGRQGSGGSAGGGPEDTLMATFGLPNPGGALQGQATPHLSSASDLMQHTNNGTAPGQPPGQAQHALPIAAVTDLLGRLATQKQQQLMADVAGLPARHSARCNGDVAGPALRSSTARDSFAQPPSGSLYASYVPTPLGATAGAPLTHSGVAAQDLSQHLLASVGGRPASVHVLRSGNSIHALPPGLRWESAHGAARDGGPDGLLRVVSLARAPSRLRSSAAAQPHAASYGSVAASATSMRRSMSATQLPNASLDAAALLCNTTGYIPGQTTLQWLQEYLQVLTADPGDTHAFIASRCLGLTACGLLGSFLTYAPRLRALTLVHTGVDDAGAVELALGLRQSCGELWLLDLRRNRIANRGATALASCLPLCPALQELVLSHNQIGDEGVMAFADALGSSANPQRVRVNHNPASPEAVKALATAYKGSRMRRSRRRRSMVLQHPNAYGAVPDDTPGSPAQGIFDNVVASEGEVNGNGSHTPPVRGPRRVGSISGRFSAVHGAEPRIGSAGVAGARSSDGMESLGAEGGDAAMNTPHRGHAVAEPPPPPPASRQPASSRRLSMVMDVATASTLANVLFAPTLLEERLISCDVAAALALCFSAPRGGPGLRPLGRHSLPNRFLGDAVAAAAEGAVAPPPPPFAVMGLALTPGPAAAPGAPTDIPPGHGPHGPPAAGSMAVPSALSATLGSEHGVASRGASLAGPAVDLEPLAAALIAAGHDAVTTLSAGGGAGGECLQNLRHRYVTVHVPQPAWQEGQGMVPGPWGGADGAGLAIWSSFHGADLTSDVVSELSAGGADDWVTTLGGGGGGGGDTGGRVSRVPSRTNLKTWPEVPVAGDPELDVEVARQPTAGMEKAARRKFQAPGVGSDSDTSPQPPPDPAAACGLMPTSPSLADLLMLPPERDGGRPARAVSSLAVLVTEPATLRDQALVPSAHSTAIAARPAAVVVPAALGHHATMPVPKVGVAASRHGSAHGGAHFASASAAATTGGAPSGAVMPGGAPFPSPPGVMRIIVDPGFKEQFEIGKHTTPRYDAILAGLPAVYVGHEERLPMLVELLCEEMAAAFKDHGLPLPPWRKSASLLSKWRAPPAAGRAPGAPTWAVPGHGSLLTTHQ